MKRPNSTNRQTMYYRARAGASSGVRPGTYVMGPVEKLCWSVAKAGGWIDLAADYEPVVRSSINRALRAGALHGGGGLTETGERYAEGTRHG